MEERCICCGEILPEGACTCPNCLLYVRQENGDEDNEVSQPCI